MVWLTCNCLNLKIHVKNSGTELVPADAAKVGVNTAEYTVDDFFTNEICQVHLDLEGVTKEHDCLIREKTIGNWAVSKCLNCRIKTHAIHRQKGDNTVLVNAKLQNETTVLKSFRASPEYSPLYNILIPGRNENKPTQSYGPRLGRFEAMQQESLIKIQQRLNTYLMAEEAAMEERIRLYEEQQRAAFSELQSKARWDKTKLISVALSVDDQDVVAGTLSEAMTESPLSPFSPGSQDITSSSASSSSDKKNSNLLRESEQKPTFLNLTRRPAPQAASVVKSPEADGMFDMEGFDDGLQEQDAGSYYESDEEDNDNDTDDSSYSSDASMRDSLRNSGHHGGNLYSQSVPMNVPMWQSHRYQQSESPDERVPGRADDIGASIKALAMSVRVDGTEIFGDLPRGSNKQFKTVEIMKRREKCRYEDDSTT